MDLKTEQAKQAFRIVAEYRNRRINGRIIDLVPFGEEWIRDFVRVRNAEKNLYFFNQQYLLTEESQKEWYDRYLERPDDIFWCILDKKGRFLGTVRLYEIDADASILTHGSFMIDAGVADEAPYALEAEILSLDFAFDMLHIGQVINENRQDNRVMNALSRQLGFAFIKNTSIGGVPYQYHLLSEDAYRKKRAKIDAVVTYWAGR